MQIVIEIPDGCYEELNSGRFPMQDAYRLVAWIKNGIPLPKNHGRLIDADELLSHTQDYGEGQLRMMLIDPYYVKNAPTIIEGVKDDDNTFMDNSNM